MKISSCVKIGCFIVASPVLVVVAPLVGLVAAPIFALKAAAKRLECKSLSDKIIAQQARVKFGRTEDEDYTRWDGKGIARDDEGNFELLVKEDLFPSGLDEVDGDDENVALPEDYPFQTQEDLDWLKQEAILLDQEASLKATLLAAKNSLDTDLKRLARAHKLIIPIIGVIWVFMDVLREPPFNDTKGEESEKMPEAEPQWSRKEALEFHRAQVERILLNKKIEELKIDEKKKKNECTICFEELGKNTRGHIIQNKKPDGSDGLKIYHQFHEECLSRSLLYRAECPLCRHFITTRTMEKIVNPYHKEKAEEAA